MASDGAAATANREAVRQGSDWDMAAAGAPSGRQAAAGAPSNRQAAGGAPSGRQEAAGSARRPGPPGPPGAGGKAKAKGRGKGKAKGTSSDRHNIELGRQGEAAAARYLERRGYDILCRNWKCAAGEADIIARDEDILVFVEVKTRSNCDKGLPEEAVGPAKRQKYEKIAAMFLKDYDVVDIQVRFDVVALLAIAPDRALVRHHINAFGVG